MNKDKAIQLLERLQDPEPYEPMLTKDAYDAIQMAIDALSADDDTISRKAAIEVIDSFNVFESRCDQIKLEQMIGELPPANNSEIPNSSDTISRAKAIEALDKRFDSIPMEQTLEILMLRKDLRELPPAQPERIRGRWIEHDYGLVACECSVCHEKYNLYEEDVFGRNFCPNCGADMREVTE